jgi:hypothetical protein
MTREEQIKCVASRIRRIAEGTEGMPMYINFWDDLDTLLNLILEEEKDE